MPTLIFLQSVLGLVICGSSRVDAAGSLTTVPTSVGGIVTACPGIVVMVTCLHDSTLLRTEWGASKPTPSCSANADHDVLVQRPVCGTFYIVQNISVASTPMRSSTLVSNPVDSSFDDALIKCYEGSSVIPNSEVGNVRLCVVGPPPSPTVDTTLYSVDNTTTGSAVITVSSIGSCGTGVRYEVSVARESGSDPVPPSIQINTNIITISTLEYNRDYTVNITAVSITCDDLVSNPTSVALQLIAAALTFDQQLEASITCSDPTLPVVLDWTLAHGNLESNNPVATPLNPPATRSVVRYSSSLGMDEVTTDSPYTFSQAVRDTAYSFAVSVFNVAGESTSSLPNPVIARVLTVDNSTVVPSSCLTVTVTDMCSEVITDGVFSVTLKHGFGSCLTLSSLTTTQMTISTYSTCLPFGPNTGQDLCYTVSLSHGGNIIETQTNVNFDSCTISDLQAFLDDGVMYILTSAMDAGMVPHLTTATLNCGGGVFMLSGDSQVTCINGAWDNGEIRSCSMSCGATIAISVIVSSILTLVLGVIIGVVSVLLYNKCRRGTGQSSSQPPAELKQVGPIYEEPEDFKPDPNTEGNVAYGHVQPLHRRQ